MAETTTKPELSIIIIHFKTPELLKLCLTSIKKTIKNINYELIVVDSSTSRQNKDMIEEKYPDVIFLPYKENLGYSRGVNIGIDNAKGNYFLVLNPDIIATENSIAEMLSYIKKHKDIGILAPQLLNFNGSIQKNYFKFYKPITVIARRSFLGMIYPFKKEIDEFLMSDSDPKKIQTPDWVMGSALMTSRKAVDEVGKMDERFFMYFEDVDWARRFWHNNYKVVYNPKAIMYHYHQRESKSGFDFLDPLFNKKTRWHIKSGLKFFLKYRNLSKINQSYAK